MRRKSIRQATIETIQANPGLSANGIIAKMKKKDYLTTKQSVFSIRSRAKKQGLVRRESKRQAILKIIKANPTFSIKSILAEMKRQGYSTTIKSINSTKYWARKQGLVLPDLRKKSVERGPSVKLNGNAATTMKEIWKNPRVSTKNTQKSLAEKGVKLSRSHIVRIKRYMKHYFPEIDFSIKPEPIKLTDAQKAMIPEFEKLIEINLQVKTSPVWKLPKQFHEEFREFVNGKILELVKKYDKSRGKKNTYISSETRFLYKKFISTTLKQNLGITFRDANQLVRIMREKYNKNIDHAQIAEKLGCPKSEVDELWTAYKNFQRIQSMLGTRKER